MKSIFATIGIIVVVVIAVYIYRQKVAPKIYFETVDHMTHSGVISFGGVQNHFGPDTGWNMMGRGGWSLEWNPGASGFKLYKGNVLVTTIPIPA